MKTILLIEDDKAIRDALQKQMELKRFNIIPAVSGPEGIKFAKIFSPDLIICNMKMSVMSGEEVLRTLSNFPEHVTFHSCSARQRQRKLKLRKHCSSALPTS